MKRNLTPFMVAIVTSPCDFEFLEGRLRDLAAASKHASRAMRLLASASRTRRQWRNHPQRRIHK
jgi:hypothetical protein